MILFACVRLCLPIIQGRAFDQHLLVVQSHAFRSCMFVSTADAGIPMISVNSSGKTKSNDPDGFFRLQINAVAHSTPRVPSYSVYRLLFFWWRTICRCAAHRRRLRTSSLSRKSHVCWKRALGQRQWHLSRRCCVVMSCSLLILYGDVLVQSTAHSANAQEVQAKDVVQAEDQMMMTLLASYALALIIKNPLIGIYETVPEHARMFSRGFVTWFQSNLASSAVLCQRDSRCASFTHSKSQTFSI